MANTSDNFSMIKKTGDYDEIRKLSSSREKVHSQEQSKQGQALSLNTKRQVKKISAKILKNCFGGKKLDSKNIGNLKNFNENNKF